MRLQALDLNDAGRAADWLELLDHYAQDPMGGGKALSAAVRADLVPRLRAHPGLHAAVLYDGATAVGLINCFTGFSTFAGGGGRGSSRSSFAAAGGSGGPRSSLARSASISTHPISSGR